jgi:hypothetical protein
MKKNLSIFSLFMLLIIITGSVAKANVPLPCILINPGNGYNVGYSGYHLEWDWIDGPEPVGFKVYLDQVNPPQTMVYQGSNTWQQVSLEFDKEYFWKVVPYNSHGDAVDVPVWSFTTFRMENFYVENFFDENPDWTVVNHSGSSKQWFFTGMSAVISTQDFYKDQTPVWSTMSSPVIDCSERENVRLVINQELIHVDEIDNYYGKIEVFDGAAWQHVGIFEGNLQSVKQIYEYNISHIADGKSNVQIRFEFNTNGDWNLAWIIERVSLRAVVQDLGQAALVSPANGALYQPLDVNLMWQKGSGPDPDGYKLYFGQQNPPLEMLYDGQNTEFSVSDLQHETTYFWKVVPYLDNESPEDIPVWSFTTRPEHATISQLPHLENFDNFPAPQLPFGWSTFIQSSCPFSELVVRSPHQYDYDPYPWSDPNYVRFRNGGHQEAILSLHTPAVSVDISNMRIRFYAISKESFDYPDAINQIQVGVISSPDNPNTFTSLGSAFLTSEWDQYMVSFESYSGDGNIISFRAVMDGEVQNVFLDNIVFEEIPEEPMQVHVPPSLDFGNIESDYESASKTVSVRNWGGGILTINPGDIFLSGEGVDAFTLHNINSTKNLLAFESFEITLDFTPLTAGNKDVILHIGEMQVQVSANSILPDIVSFPYFQNFDAVVAPALPSGWRKIIESTDPANDIITRHIGSLPSAPLALRFTSGNDADAALYAITPLVIPGNQVDELWVRFYCVNDFRHNYMIVGIMSEREDPSSFVEVEKVWMYAEPVYWEYAVRIPVTQEQFYIAFKPDFYRRQRLMFIDDVTIQAAPALHTVNIIVKEASAEGTPLQGAELTVLGHSPITTRQVYSPENGQISMQLEAGTHTIFANLPGYQQRQVVFEVTPQGATVVVDMTHVMYPPFNLNAESTKPGEATLSWNDPGDVFEFRYDSGQVNGSLGFGADWQQELNALGSAFHFFAELHEISWYLTEDDGPHDNILLWVTGLDQYGYPDINNILYWNNQVSNVDNQWNVYQLPEPVLTPNGFFIGLGYDGFLSLGTDNGSTHPYQFIPERHFAIGPMHSIYEEGYPIEMFGFQVNFLLRAHGYKISSLEFEKIQSKENISELPKLQLKKTASKNSGEPLVNVKSPVLSPWASSNVYLNDMEQPFASWINESIFTFNELAAGSYTAGVQTAFSTIESEIVNITFNVQQSVNVETHDISQLKLFPNPANNVLNIVSANLIEQVKIFDLLGSLVYYSEPNDNNIIINTGDLKEGMYLMQIFAADDIITKKVNIVR